MILALGSCLRTFINTFLKLRLLYLISLYAMYPVYVLCWNRMCASLISKVQIRVISPWVFSEKGHLRFQSTWFPFAIISKQFPTFLGQTIDLLLFPEVCALKHWLWHPCLLIIVPQHMYILKHRTYRLFVVVCFISMKSVCNFKFWSTRLNMDFWQYVVELKKMPLVRT